MLRTSPLRFTGIHLNFVPPPPRISGGPATSVTSMVATHLAGVADRIDRSFSPCGGREERELLIFQRNSGEGNSYRGCLLHPPHSLSFPCMVSMIRFPCEISIQNRNDFHCD